MTKKLILSLTILFTAIACVNRDFFSKRYGYISSDSILRIEYYNRQTLVGQEGALKPFSFVTERELISKIVEGINYSNNPEPWKGAQWDKICLIKKDTFMTLNTNGEVIGPQNSSGLFYKFSNKDIIVKYLLKR